VLVPVVDRTLCCGLIGVGSASFCFRRNYNVNKLSGISEATFFISRVNDATVFTQPSIDQSKVPSGTQAKWEGKIKSLSTWVREFRAIAIADDGAATSDDIKDEIKLLDEGASFRTPLKKRKSHPLHIVPIPSHTRTLPEPGDNDLLERMNEGGTLGREVLTRVVSRPKTSVVDKGKTLEEVVGLVHGRFVDNEEIVHLVSGAVQNLMATLGPTEQVNP
jgi:hypothetical protein